MNREEIQARLEELSVEESRQRARLEELEEITQSARGSHSPGPPSPEAISAEREIRRVVLRLVEIDYNRQEMTVALSLA
ncbi:MAG TPA: hypothetical protein VKA70_22050 [Blastocatellia bacterium]|nr:hypothetical protein [Blastocatellia bacterium]